MDADTWTRLNRLLDEALDLPPAERLPWVDRLGAADADLGPRLRALLARAASPTSAGFLDTIPKLSVAARDDVPNPSALTEGAIVGPYRVIRVIGEGGMGAVWLAERMDGVLKRQVALKVPRGEWLSTTFRERLERERDILAALNHPNIARLYDAGTTDAGQPFLALELVDGQPIDEFVNRWPLDLPARLRLFLQVARAVAYAHRNLVVHRDLKPSNILVTPDGQAKLLDFGIARLLDDNHPRETPLTALAGRAMTLEYASPEQVAGEPIAVASDIYSLGVVLFRLLTGADPYGPRRLSRSALEQAIQSGTYLRLSDAVEMPTQRRLLKGDLDTIVLKAMKTSPEERYATVDAFADDIDRYLAGQPVLARPDTTWYRTSKFIRRHAWPSVMAAVAVVALVTGAGLALSQARVARAEQQRAEEVKAFITGIFRNANLDAENSRPMTVLDLLKEARLRVTALDTSPSVRVELLDLIGTSILSLGDTDALEQVATQAVRESEGGLSTDDPLAIEARLLLAWTHMYRGRPEQMRAEVDRVMAIAQRETSRFSRQLVTAWRLRGDAAIDSGRYDEAEAAAREAVALAEAVYGPREQDTMLALNLLADCLRRTGKVDEAVSVAERVLRVSESLHAGQLLHPEVYNARQTYGKTLCDVGRLAECFEQLSRAVEEGTQLFGKDSRSIGFTLQNLSGYQLRAGRILESLENARLAAERAKSHAEPGSFTVAASQNNVARALLAARRGREAVPVFDEVIVAAERIFGPAHTNTLAARADRALARAYAGEITKATEEMRTILADMRKAGSPTARVLLNAGVLARLAGDAPGALDLLREVPPLLPGDRLSRADLGVVQTEMGRLQVDRSPAEAEALLTTALATLAEAEQVETPTQADARLALARLRLREGRAADALPLLEQVDRFWRDFAPGSPWANESSRALADGRVRLAGRQASR